MSETVVDPAHLRALAGRAEGLSSEVGGLGSLVEELSPAAAGDPGLAAAVGAFVRAWRARAVEMEAELTDAGEFLRTFADAAEQMDASLSE